MTGPERCDLCTRKGASQRRLQTSTRANQSCTAGATTLEVSEAGLEREALGAPVTPAQSSRARTHARMHESGLCQRLTDQPTLILPCAHPSLTTHTRSATLT